MPDETPNESEEERPEEQPASDPAADDESAAAQPGPDETDGAEAPIEGEAEPADSPDSPEEDEPQAEEAAPPPTPDEEAPSDEAPEDPEPDSDAPPPAAGEDSPPDETPEVATSEPAESGEVAADSELAELQSQLDAVLDSPEDETEPSPAGSGGGAGGLLDQAAIDALLGATEQSEGTPPAETPAAAPLATEPRPQRPHPTGRGQRVGDLDLLADVVLVVSAEIGRTDITIEEVLKLRPGSLVELDKLAGEPVELYVHDRCIARGEVVVVDDNFGIRITEIGPHS